jgi:hypothetical protein
MTLASASSPVSSPRSNWVSQSWMKLAEILLLRYASRRPMMPDLMS